MKHLFSQNKMSSPVKLTALLIACVMLLSAASCGSKKAPEVTSDSESALEELNVKELDTELTDFLIRFSDWYYDDDSDDKHYNYENAGDGDTNILRCVIGNMPCVDWEKYPVTAPQEIWDDKKPDPKKWSKETGGYMVFDSNDAEWITLHIFNASKKDIKTMREQGKNNKWFYLHEGKYYVPAGGVGDPPTEYIFESAKTDGKRYYVDFSMYFNNGEEREYVATYSAQTELKNIDGNDYWTLIDFEQITKGE